MEYIYNYILYLINNKKITNNNKTNIAELGIGNYIKIAKLLNKHNNINLIVVDLNNKSIENCKNNNLNGVVDNLFNPKLEIYKNINLIYSIRPPRDLQPYILSICKKYNIKLIIKPLLGEEPINELKLINYKGNVLYTYNID